MGDADELSIDLQVSPVIFFLGMGSKIESEGAWALSNARCEAPECPLCSDPYARAEADNLNDAIRVRGLHSFFDVFVEDFFGVVPDSRYSASVAIDVEEENVFQPFLDILDLLLFALIPTF